MSSNPSRRTAPVAASRHRVLEGRRDVDGTGLLTVYLVLLLGIPSSVIITPLGSLGRPSLLWGLVLFVWWLIARLQVRVNDVHPVWQPVRLAFCVLLVIVLVSFAGRAVTRDDAGAMRAVAMLVCCIEQLAGRSIIEQRFHAALNIWMHRIGFAAIKTTISDSDSDAVTVVAERLHQGLIRRTVPCDEAGRDFVVELHAGGGLNPKHIVGNS